MNCGGSRRSIGASSSRRGIACANPKRKAATNKPIGIPVRQDQGGERDESEAERLPLAPVADDLDGEVRAGRGRRAPPRAGRPATGAAPPPRRATAWPPGSRPRSAGGAPSACDTATNVAGHDRAARRTAPPARGSGRRVPSPHGKLRQQRDVDPGEVRTARVRLGRLLEEDVRQEPREPDRDEVDHDARHDVIDPERDRGHGVHGGERARRRPSRTAARAPGPSGTPRPRSFAKNAAPERAGHGPDHHQTFEADVDDARALAEQTAEPCQVQDREVGEADLDRGTDVVRTIRLVPLRRGIRTCSATAAVGAGAARAGVRDLVHDDDREDQDALQDDDELSRQIGSSCSAVSPRDSTDQTIAAKMIPIGLFRAEERDRDAA